VKLVEARCNLELLIFMNKQPYFNLIKIKAIVGPLLQLDKNSAYE